jgi:hypothetical protein
MDIAPLDCPDKPGNDGGRNREKAGERKVPLHTYRSLCKQNPGLTTGVE